MKSAVQCFTLLACVIICFSADTVTLQCKCPKTSKGVKPSLISDVTEYKPRPYCNKHEVIVTLKDKTQRCLDPKGRFTEAVLKTMAMMREKQLAEKMKITTRRPQQSNSTSRSSDEGETTCQERGN